MHRSARARSAEKVLPSNSRAYRRSAVWSGPQHRLRDSASLPPQPRGISFGSSACGHIFELAHPQRLGARVLVHLLPVSLPPLFLMPRRCYKCGEIYYGGGECASGLERCNELHQRIIRLRRDYWEQYWREEVAPTRAVGQQPLGPAEEPNPRAAGTASVQPPQDLLEMRLMNVQVVLQAARNLQRSGYSTNPDQLMLLWEMLRQIRREAGMS